MQMRKWIGPGAAVALLAVLGTSAAQTASSPRKARRSDRDAVSDAPKPQAPAGSVRGQQVAKGVALPDGIAARLSQRGGKVAVMIELAEAPAAVAYSQARSGSPAAKSGRADASGVAAARARLASIERAQQTVLGALRATDATVLYRVQKAYNGIAARVNMRDIPQIRRMPGVKAVRLLIPEHMSNGNSVPFVGAPSAWVKGLGYTGQGIKVGIIDTGIDYLHANFGGPGFFADYRGLDPATPATYNVFNTVGDDPNYPGVKVAGGYDFAGDAYDANDDTSVPVPDDDPMDCNGHGSHVAGTVGGYGVDDFGNTFNGPYGPGTDFNSLIIGPGVAPKVTLYALRVFGCGGSTNLTVQAIDWATDPNGDGDFSDHLDVINMSLGSNFGSEFDPSAVASQNASLAGVLVAAASGNAGDTYYITSAPAVAPRAVSVAGSLDKAATLSGLVVNSPPAQAGIYAASEAAFGPDLAAGDVTGDLANGPSCGPVPAMAGQIALIPRGGCTAPSGPDSGSFKGKVWRAQQAGAIGVVITNNVNGFPVTMGDDPDTPGPITIPSMMVSLSDGDAFRAAITGGATVNVTLTDDHRERIKSIQPAVEDTVYASSSRGAARAGTALKPDVTSVAESVFSTEALSGTEGDSFTGTSMATPHIAGTLALLKQIHPTWTVEELKALVMNTANHDVYRTFNGTLPKIGPGRSGAGRQDVTAAVNTNVVAYNGDGSGRVSVSFGAVEVAGTAMLTKPIVVKNRGGSSASYTIAYSGANMPDVAGVAFSTSAANVTVAAGATATFNVILTADAAAMKHSRDASVSNGQSGIFRHFVSEEAGYVTLTPATGPVLRVPVYAAPRAVSAMGTALSGIDISTGPNTGSRSVSLTGTGISTGSSFGTTSPFPGQDEVSLVSAFELQEKSPEEVPGPGPDDSADLRYVGVARTNDGFGDVVNFGIATYGNFSTANLADSEYDIYIDLDQDGNDDFLLANWNFGSAVGAGSQDNFVSVLVDLSTEVAIVQNFINGLHAGQRDTVLYNNRVMNIQAYATGPGSLGVTGAFDYQVFSYNREMGLVDVSDRHTYDISTPGLSAPGSSAYAPFGAPVYDDLDGNSIPVAFDRAAYNAAGSLGLLLLHHHNATPNQAQVVDVAAIPQAKGDFNADGKLDLLWRDQGNTGQIATWFMDGATMTGSAAITPAFPFLNWEIVGQGDFDGDGDADILWRDQASTGQMAVWFMDGVNMTSSTLTTPTGFPHLNWKIVGVGDFDGDGDPDIAFRDQASTGQIAIWFMDGTNLVSASLTNPAAFPLLNWQIVGVADFNGDGKPDFLWRDTQSTGQLAIWYMDGLDMIGAAATNPPSFPLLNWQVQAVGDFDGDHKPDIVWRDQTGGTGQIAMWFMDDETMTSATLTNPPAFNIPSWRIVGPK